MDSDICTEDDDDVIKTDDVTKNKNRTSEQRDSEQREIDEFEEEERRIMALEVQVKRWC